MSFMLVPSSGKRGYALYGESLASSLLPTGESCSDVHGESCDASQAGPFLRWLRKSPIVVDRIEPPSPEAFMAQYDLPHKPVVISGLASEWPALKAWTIPYMKDHVSPHAPVKVSLSSSHIFPDLEARDTSISISDVAGTKTKVVPFWSYLDYIDRHNGEGGCTPAEYMYMLGDFAKFWSDGVGVATFSRLWEDVRVPAYVNAATFATAGFWVSQKGVVARCHYDRNRCHNLNTQLRGSKTFLLFPPEEFQRLYGPFADDPPLLQAFSRFPVHLCRGDADIERTFPLAKDLQCHVATVCPGETLFIPACWYHAVIHNDDININVNFWWRSKRSPNLPPGFPIDREEESTPAPSRAAQFLSGQKPAGVFWNVHNMEGRSL